LICGGVTCNNTNYWGWEVNRPCHFFAPKKFKLFTVCSPLFILLYNFFRGCKSTNKETQKKSPLNIMERKEDDWQPSSFKRWLQDIFRSKKWVTCKTAAGECAPDSIAVALKFPRTRQTWNTLRDQILENADLTKGEMEKKRFEGAWLADTDIKYFFLEKLRDQHLIPVFVDAREDAEFRFVYEPHFFKKYAKIQHSIQADARKAKTEVDYVMFRYNGTHFDTIGAQCKHVQGQPFSVRTVFTESQLPAGLLEAWQQDADLYKKKHMQTAAQKREALRKKSTQKTKKPVYELVEDDSSEETE